MAKKIYDLLKPEYYEEVDHRLVATLQPMQQMFAAEEALLSELGGHAVADGFV